MEEQKSTFLGRWKSGRPWKTISTARNSSMIKSRGSGLKTWEEKTEERQVKMLEKARQKEILEQQEVTKQIIRKKRAEKIKRKEQNAQKSMIVQKVSNSRKIKRMSKKQRKSLIKTK